MYGRDVMGLRYVPHCSPGVSSARGRPRGGPSFGPGPPPVAAGHPGTRAETEDKKPNLSAL